LLWRLPPVENKGAVLSEAWLQLYLMTAHVLLQHFNLNKIEITLLLELMFTSPQCVYLYERASHQPTRIATTFTNIGFRGSTQTDFC
jgi:hypothetical protein